MKSSGTLTISGFSNAQGPRLAASRVHGAGGSGGPGGGRYRGSAHLCGPAGGSPLGGGPLGGCGLSGGWTSPGGTPDDPAPLPPGLWPNSGLPIALSESDYIDLLGSHKRVRRGPESVYPSTGDRGPMRWLSGWSAGGVFGVRTEGTGEGSGLPPWRTPLTYSSSSGSLSVLATLSVGVW